VITRLEGGAIAERRRVEKRSTFECRPSKVCIVSEHRIVKLNQSGEDGIVKLEFVTEDGGLKGSPFERSTLERGPVTEDRSFEPRPR